jgi:hypothetical protein
MVNPQENGGVCVQKINNWRNVPHVSSVPTCLKIETTVSKELTFPTTTVLQGDEILRMSENM